MTFYPRSVLSTPVTVPRNEGNDTVCSVATHKRTLSTDHVEKRKLKPNVGHHTILLQMGLSRNARES